MCHNCIRYNMIHLVQNVTLDRKMYLLESTLYSKLRSGVDSAMFILSHALVHPRILQGQVTDLKASPVHLDPVLGWVVI